MVIDLIIDRVCVAKKYDSKEFYNRVMEYYSTFPEIVEPIANALDSGEEKDIKKELCNYIQEQGYSTHIFDYINSNNWL